MGQRAAMDDFFDMRCALDNNREPMHGVLANSEPMVVDEALVSYTKISEVMTDIMAQWHVMQASKMTPVAWLQDKLRAGDARKAYAARVFQEMNRVRENFHVSCVQKIDQDPLWRWKCLKCISRLISERGGWDCGCGHKNCVTVLSRQTRCSRTLAAPKRRTFSPLACTRWLEPR